MNNVAQVRDRKLSLWQSAVEEVAARQQGTAKPVPGKILGELTVRERLLRQPMVQAATVLAQTLDPLQAAKVAVSPAFAAESASEMAALPDFVGQALDCNKLYLRLAWAKLRGDQHEVAKVQQELKYSTCDPAWAETVEVYLSYFKLNKGSIPYRSGDDYVLDYQLPAKATIALLGDWGTGTQAALDLLKQVGRKKPDVLFHLGDIYYSGTLRETQSCFLDGCRQALDAGTRIFSLSGNHDMYSGGAGYYWLVDKLQQRASYFCIRNDAWQFLAMDTGYNDFDPFSVASHVTSLTPVEAAWHIDKIGTAGPRKTVLLSHHQLFSAYDPIAGGGVNNELCKQLKDVLDKVAIWFWGHEHNLSIYASFLGLQRGRCLGCGAIPVFVADDYYQARFPMPLVSDPRQPDRPIELGNNGDIYNHAYAILQLDGTAATVSYYQSTDEDKSLYVEAIA